MRHLNNSNHLKMMYQILPISLKIAEMSKVIFLIWMKAYLKLISLLYRSQCTLEFRLGGAKLNIWLALWGPPKHGTHAQIANNSLFLIFGIKSRYWTQIVAKSSASILVTMPGFNSVLRTVVAACTCQKHVTNVSNHNSMCKSDGAMPFSLGCQKVMDYPESAKTLY